MLLKLRHRQFFWRFVFLVKFSCWFKFHVNIVTGSGVMTTFVHKRKGLTRNPEIGNTSVQVLPKIWRLSGVRDTKFGRNVSKEKLFNAAKYRGSEFSSYEIELRNQLLTRKFLDFELLTQRFNFYFFTFKLLTRSWKIKSYTLSY